VNLGFLQADMCAGKDPPS